MRPGAGFGVERGLFQFRGHAVEFALEEVYASLVGMRAELRRQGTQLQCVMCFLPNHEL